MFSLLKSCRDAFVYVCLVVAVAVMSATSAYALPIYPVDAMLDDVKSDIGLWGTAFIGLALGLVAYKWIRKVVK